jgi:hypothetical protein
MQFREPILTSDGLHQGCQYRAAGGWRISHALTTPATKVVVIITQRWRGGDPVPVGTTYFVCSRHAGTIRSNVSRARYYSERDYRFVPGTPETTHRENTARLETIAWQNERENEAAAARRRIIETSPDLVTRHLYTASLDDTGVGPVTTTNPDEYGRSFVRFYSNRLTPGQARNLARMLMSVARAAETRSVAVTE